MDGKWLVKEIEQEANWCSACKCCNGHCNRLEDDIRDWDSGAKAIEEGMNF